MSGRLADFGRLLSVVFLAFNAGCGGDESAQSSGGTAGSSGGTGGSGGGSDGGPTPAFRRVELRTEFYSEGASFGDFDRDGVGDVVSGPKIYLGPDFTKAIELYTVAQPLAVDAYSDNFFAFPYDLDADGWLDVLFVGFPGQEAYWFRNPASPAAAWTRHSVFAAVDNESPIFVDVTGDAKPELVCATGGKLGWAAPDWNDPKLPWTFHAATGPEGYVPFTHGLGVGDVDGDTRADLLEAKGVRLAPASLAGDPLWPFEAHALGSGGAQMFATDVDADGDADIITSLAAHGYGLAWFEQVEQAGQRAFVLHEISSSNPAEPAPGVPLHEPHALALADVNADGLSDIVAGERVWGHYDGWPSAPDTPASLYWFELRRGSAGVAWIPHLIDADSGVGTQVTAGDVDGDGRIDVVVGNKKGAFVFVQDAGK